MVKTLISLALIGLMVGTGALIAKVMVDTKPAPAEKAAVLPPLLVQTVEVRPETLTERIIGYGSARPYRSATVTTEVGGEIVGSTEGLQDGSPVAAGQLLARIDERRYIQQLAQAAARVEVQQAQLQQADVREANLRRLLSICEQEVKVNRDEERRLAGLFEAEAASKKEYDFARLAYQRSLRESTAYQNQLDLIEPERKQLRASIQGRLAEVEVAKLDVEHCRILAPFDGQIDELLVEVGERVQPGSPIATVIDPWQIEVPVQLPASAYPQVLAGAPVELWAESMSNLRWSGKVERKSPDADEQSRTFRAYVEVDNRRQTTPLVAGYFLSAAVIGPTLENAMLVPRGAIIEDHVFVTQPDATVRERLQAQRRRIAVERFIGERAVVSGELQAGDAVIVTNLDKVNQDVAVRVDESGQAASEDHARGQW